MLAVQSFGYAVAGAFALGALTLGRSVDATLLGVCFAVVHFFVMIFMIRSMQRIRRLQDLRNGRIAAWLACAPFISPAIWTCTTASSSFLDVAENLNLDGPADWSENVDTYLYGTVDNADE